MIRLLLLMLLLLSSGPTYAEWESITESVSGTTVYVDRDTIRRKGELVKMWYLFDFKTVQTVAGTSYLSSTFQSEFDCAEERRRFLAWTKFSGNMKIGKVVDTYSGEEKWVPVQPGSIDQALWTTACSKK